MAVTLGESPRWHCAQRDWLLSLREFQSCFSALADSFLFRKRLRPSHPPVLFLSGTCEEQWSHWSRSSRKYAQGTGSCHWIWKRDTFTSGSPPSQTILEIRIQGGGISIQGPPVWVIPGSPHFYAMHGCSSIRILNYLDDKLILAQTEAVSTSHKTLLLSHLDCLGLRVNFAKSVQSTSQRVSFLGSVMSIISISPKRNILHIY